MLDLKTVREQKRLTQQDLSALTGLPQSHVTKIESGKMAPTIRTQARLEKILGAEVDWVSTVSGDKAHVTAKMVELINLQVDGVKDRIVHVRRILHSIEQSLKIENNE